MSVEITQVPYAGWPHCYRVTNGQIELIATTDVGPRIIRLGFLGEENEFAEFKDQVGRTGGGEWRIYGGHRLWHSPEARTRTYIPDNSPIEAFVEGKRLRLVQPTEPETRVQKEIWIELEEERPRARILHILHNRGLWPIELAPWALSVMAPGGQAVIPHTQKAHPDRLLPNRAVVLWPYTDMQDPRVHWGTRYLILRQDSTRSQPFKIGMTVYDGWCAYYRRGHCFIKKFSYQEGSTYADYGANVETYTNAEMLELETLGPLARLEPGESTEHWEEWRLVKVGEVTDEPSIEREILPQVQSP